LYVMDSVVTTPSRTRMLLDTGSSSSGGFECLVLQALWNSNCLAGLLAYKALGTGSVTATRHLDPISGAVPAADEPPHSCQSARQSLSIRNLRRIGSIVGRNLMAGS
jgi:hypothetical protein